LTLIDAGSLTMSKGALELTGAVYGISAIDHIRMYFNLYLS
jgi:hypothetical protein